MEVKRFSTPDPTTGDPRLFELEVVRIHQQQVGEGDDAHTEDVRERETLTFAARPDVSGGVLLQVEMMGGLGGKRKNARGADALMDFYDAALMPEAGSLVVDDQSRDYLGQPEFRKTVDDPDTYVHIDTLIDIATWLYAEYATRPTKQPPR